MKRSKLSEAARIIADSGSFFLAGHTSPDGDCLGSICALTIALSRLGKSVTPVSVDGVPDAYSFLPAVDRIQSRVPEGEFDAAIIVDSDRPDRLGPSEEVLARCRRLIVIDHHLDGQWTAGVQLIDNRSASCGEIVYELLRELGVALDQEIAECIMTAVVTDTGSFRFSNVTPSTLRVAAELVEAGALPGKVAHAVYEARTPSATKLLGLALSKLTVTDGGRIAYAAITRADMEAAGSDDSESEGIVNFVRSIRGVDVGILFRETLEGTVRVSLRSNDGLDVSQVARAFGGGGHKAAAGCTVEAELPSAIELVVGTVRKWMVY
ncbi:MAG: DHH family phosphoesterase [Armatimonadota bacterium]